jgi:DNA-binding LacI/PurR family transcriptional regulator
VRQPIEQMAKLAVETVLDLIGTSAADASKRIVQPELIQRESCASPR